MTAESRFFASATAPVAAGLDATLRVVVVDGPLEAGAFPAALLAALGVPVVLVDVGGLRRAAVVEAVELEMVFFSAVLEGEETLPLGAADVRLAALVADALGRFLSSSDTDDWERWLAAVEDVAAGRLAIEEPAGGLVGGLLIPVEEVLGLARDLVAVPLAAAGRRTPEVATPEGRFDAADAVLPPGLGTPDLVADEVVFSVFGDAVVSDGAASDGAVASEGASSLLTTSKPSRSDMVD